MTNQARERAINLVQEWEVGCVQDVPTLTGFTGQHRARLINLIAAALAAPPKCSDCQGMLGGAIQAICHSCAAAMRERALAAPPEPTREQVHKAIYEHVPHAECNVVIDKLLALFRGARGER